MGQVTRPVGVLQPTFILYLIPPTHLQRVQTLYQVYLHNLTRWVNKNWLIWRFVFFTFLCLMLFVVTAVAYTYFVIQATHLYSNLTSKSSIHSSRSRTDWNFWFVHYWYELSKGF